MKNNKVIYNLLAVSAVTLFVTGCSLSEIKSTSLNIETPANISELETTDTEQVPVKSRASLDLSNRKLDKLDMSIFNRTELEALNVSSNSLPGALPSQIGNLKNLKILNASNNNFTGIPAEVGQLSQLEILDFSNNNLTGLPNELGNLKNLKTFNISGNQFSEYDLNIIREKLPNTEFITQ